MTGGKNREKIRYESHKMKIFRLLWMRWGYAILERGMQCAGIRGSGAASGTE